MFDTLLRRLLSPGPAPLPTPEAHLALAALLVRVARADGHYAPAEQALFAAMQATVPAADAEFANGDYTASLMTLAALRAPVDAFFDGVMVNAEDPALKANRLGLLRELHTAMNRVADLSRLAT